MATQTTKTRYKDETVYCGFYSGSSCGTSPLQKSYTGRMLSESVESVRGKPEYVQVGSKRRKKFNPFRRYKFDSGSTSTAHVCYAPGGYYGWTDVWPIYDVASFVHDVDPYHDYGTWWDGDLPLIGAYALQKLGNELREHVIRDMYIKANSPRFNAAVFFAELDETVAEMHGLFKNAFGSLRRGALAKKNLKHMILNPEELWLWWRYALMPAMMDAEDLISLVMDKEVPIDRIRDGDRSEEPITETGTCRLLRYGPSKNVVCSLPWEAKYTYGCGGALDILMRHDPAPYGTSAWDIVQAGWERIPFSFIFDWFVNVGDWLASLRKLEIAYAQSYATFAIESKVTFKGGSPWEIDAGESPEITTFLMERIVDIEPPSLPLIDRRWRNLTRTIDLFSLTIGILKGVLNRRK